MGRGRGKGVEGEGGGRGLGEREVLGRRITKTQVVGRESVCVCMYVYNYILIISKCMFK